MDGVEFEPGSFRDRRARIFRTDGEILRALDDEAERHWRALSATAFFRRFTESGGLVATEELDASALHPSLGGQWKALLRHERLPFVSYPFEWSFGMLKDAALLYLDLLLAALSEGLVIKDGTAYNVQWRGAQPVFIDIGSFERQRAGEPWAGYRQFCQLFLFPLLLQAHKDLAFHPWLRGSLDGIDPEQCRAVFSTRDLLRRGVLAHVFLQAKAQSRYGGVSRDIKGDLRDAGFGAALIKSNARGLRRVVESLEWRRERSTWSDYERHNSYDEADAARKAAFVEDAARGRPRGMVWDLGCNTGAFSRIAARHAGAVVALDADHLAVERLYRSLRDEGNRQILPLVFNVADPSPDLGWRNRERQRLEQRGRPDLVLCLALIHHLVVGANIPLAEVLAWFAWLGGDLVVEFVGKDDPMVRRLLQNKEDIYRDYEWAHFERELEARFDILRRERLASGTRWLYLARPRERRES